MSSPFTKLSKFAGLGRSLAVQAEISTSMSPEDIDLAVEELVASDWDANELGALLRSVISAQRLEYSVFAGIFNLLCNAELISSKERRIALLLRGLASPGMAVVVGAAVGAQHVNCAGHEPELLPLLVCLCKLLKALLVNCSVQCEYVALLVCLRVCCCDGSWHLWSRHGTGLINQHLAVWLFGFLKS